MKNKNLALMAFVGGLSLQTAIAMENGDGEEPKSPAVNAVTPMENGDGEEAKGSRESPEFKIELDPFYIAHRPENTILAHIPPDKLNAEWEKACSKLFPNAKGSDQASPEEHQQAPMETQTIPVQQKHEHPIPVKAGFSRPSPLNLEGIKKSTIVISSPKPLSPVGSPKTEGGSPKTDPLRRASKTLPTEQGSPRTEPLRRASKTLSTDQGSPRRRSSLSTPPTGKIKDVSPRMGSPRRDESLSPKSQDREPSPAPQRLEGGDSPKSISGDRERTPERGRERDVSPGRIHEESQTTNPEREGRQSPMRTRKDSEGSRKVKLVGAEDMRNEWGATPEKSNTRRKPMGSSSDREGADLQASKGSLIFSETPGKGSSLEFRSIHGQIYIFHVSPENNSSADDEPVQELLQVLEGNPPQL
jgi:hypothetical protein